VPAARRRGGARRRGTAISGEGKARRKGKRSAGRVYAGRRDSVGRESGHKITSAAFGVAEGTNFSESSEVNSMGSVAAFKSGKES